MSETKWAVFERWRHEGMDCGRGWSRVSDVPPFDTLMQALIKMRDLEQEDSIMNGERRMSYAVEEITIEGGN